MTIDNVGIYMFACISSLNNGQKKDNKDLSEQFNRLDSFHFVVLLKVFNHVPEILFYIMI